MGDTTVDENRRRKGKKNRDPICNIWQFLLSTCSYSNWIQATNMSSVNVELGKDVHKMFSWTRDTACSASVPEAEPTLGGLETGKREGGVLPSQPPGLSVSPRRELNGIKMWLKTCKTAEVWSESPLIKTEPKCRCHIIAGGCLLLWPSSQDALESNSMYIPKLCLSARLSTSGKY